MVTARVVLGVVPSLRKERLRNKGRAWKNYNLHKSRSGIYSEEIVTSSSFSRDDLACHGEKSKNVSSNERRLGGRNCGVKAFRSGE